MSALKDLYADPLVCLATRVDAEVCVFRVYVAETFEQDGR